jgi:hypothetical protein
MIVASLLQDWHELKCLFLFHDQVWTASVHYCSLHIIQQEVLWRIHNACVGFVVLTLVGTKSSIFREKMPWNPVEFNQRIWVESLDGGCMFLQNVRWLSRDYTVYYPRRCNSSCHAYFHANYSVCTAEWAKLLKFIHKFLTLLIWRILFIYLCIHLFKIL